MRSGARRSARRPKIAFVETTEVSVRSHLAGQLSHLQGGGFEVLVISSSLGALGQFAEAENVRWRDLPLGRRPSPLKDLWSLVRLAWTLSRERPDIVVYGTPKAALLGALAAWCVGVSRRVYVVHGLRLETTRGLTRRMLRSSERITTGLSTDVVAVGQELRELFANAVGVSLQRIRVLGNGSANGVDLKRFTGPSPAGRRAARERLGLPVEQFVLLFIGRVTRDKGVEELVTAFEGMSATHPETRLMVVGSTECEPDDLRRWKTIAGEGAVWRDQLEEIEVALAAADCLVLPSHREGLPNVVLEAASMGLPVVASTATGVREILGEKAPLVPVGDAPALERVLTDLVTSPRPARVFAAELAVRIRDEFDRERVWENWHDFFSDITPARGKATSTDAPTVLWLSKGLDRGGAETLMLDLARSPALQRFQIHLAGALSSAMEMRLDFADAGVTVHDLGGNRTLDPRWIVNLARILRSGQFDLVHAHSPLMASACRLVSACLPGGPMTVSTEHGLRSYYQPWTRLLNDLTAGRDERRIAVSDAVRESFGGGRRGSAPLETIYHGRDFARLTSGRLSTSAARESLGIGGADFVAVCVANFRVEKNLPGLIDAVAGAGARMRPWRLLLVGGGSEEPVIRDRIERHGLSESITLLGLGEPWAALAAADVFVSSSTVEGLPVSMMEAQAFGLPIVATDVGGVPEVVSPPANGLLVPADDMVSLGGALDHLSRSRAELERMSARALEDSSRFSVELSASAYEQIYSNLLCLPRRSSG